MRADRVAAARSIARVRDLQTETVEVLQRLIRFQTVNPPGAERVALEWLAAYLEQAGFHCELLALDPERPNLIARLPGDRDGPTLAYLGHVDTVLATPADWSVDPWSGRVADGHVWGRGAIDMKSQVAAEAVAAATLAREGFRPRGELLLMFVSDEEAGGRFGARWLTEEHPAKVRCDLLVNEGGGAVLPYRDRRLYGVCVAEKGVFRFSVHTEGVAGHASYPSMGENALLKMGPLLERLRDQPPYDLAAEPAAFIAGLGEDDGDPIAALARVREEDPRLATLVEPMLGVTLTPTRIRASDKINVIPAQARLDVDCRVPPGLGPAEALERIRTVVPEDGYRLEVREQTVGNRSPMEGVLMDAIRDWVGEHDPGAEVVPTMLPGFTDSRWFREAFPDCVAYGFFPHRHMTLLETAPLMHAADERIDVRDLGFAAAFYRDLAERVLG
jgi:acetylornithine deacetylase/succinyl-diaminopimelate desuccinylase-like protein